LTLPVPARNSVLRTLPSARNSFEPCVNVAICAVVRIVASARITDPVSVAVFVARSRCARSPLTGSRPFVKANVACLINRGPLTRVRKLCRKLARRSCLFRPVPNLPRDLHAAGARELLQLILSGKVKVHLLAAHAHNLLDGLHASSRSAGG